MTTKCRDTTMSCAHQDKGILSRRMEPSALEEDGETRQQREAREKDIEENIGNLCTE